MGDQREERTGGDGQRGQGRLSGATGTHRQWGVGSWFTEGFQPGDVRSWSKIGLDKWDTEAGTDLEPYIHTAHTYIHAFSIP